MNFYEIVYIVHPALQAGHLDDTVNQINKKIDLLKGEVLFFENWGKKKLSYMIQKQKYGTYILFQCKIDGQNINDLTSEFEHNANILRHLISKVNEDEILEPPKIAKEKSVQEQKVDDENVVKSDKDKQIESESNNKTDKEIKSEESVKEEVQESKE